MGYGVFGTSEEEQKEGDEAVEEEDLEAELIAKPLFGVEFEDVAYDRREDSDEGNPAVVDRALGEEAKGVETQQGTVGEACHIEDGVDERLIVERAEGNDYQQIDQGEPHMDDPSNTQFLFLSNLIILITLIILTKFQKVIAECGGECR